MGWLDRSSERLDSSPAHSYVSEDSHSVFRESESHLALRDRCVISWADMV